MQFMYPTASIEVKEKSVKGNLRCRLVISRPQYYENNGSYINQSIIEAQAEMEALAINITSAKENNLNDERDIRFFLGNSSNCGPQDVITSP